MDQQELLGGCPAKALPLVSRPWGFSLLHFVTEHVPVPLVSNFSAATGLAVTRRRMISLVHEMEQRLPPALLRSYVVNGSAHGMHRSEELWTLEYEGAVWRSCVDIA